MIKKHIIHVLKENKLILLCLLVFNILASVSTIVQPVVIKSLFDDVFPNQDYQQAIVLIVVLVLIPFFYAVFNSITVYFNNDLGNRLSKSLRERLFEHILHMKPASINNIGRGEIINRLTSQIGMLCGVYITGTILTIVTNIILLIVTLWVMLTLSFQLTLVAILALPLFAFLFKLIKKKATELDKKYYGVLEQGMVYLNDFFSNIRSVQIYSGQENEKRKWHRWNLQSWNISKKSHVFHDMVLNVLSDIIISVVTGIILGYSLFLILRGQISTGTLLAFIIILPRLYNVFKSIFTANVDIHRMKVIVTNLEDIFSQEVITSGELLPDHHKIAEIECKDVSFYYEVEDKIREFNFNAKVPAGSFVGIVGLSGSGKSTLFELIHRQIEPQSGDILINGINIHHYDLRALREYVGYNQQKNTLWNLSIRENIMYPLSDEDVTPEHMETFTKVVELTNVSDFIEKLPEKYDTIVKNNGENFSGGEIQRILLARTFMNKPKLLLLDEYTSAVDSITESYMSSTLKQLKGECTIMVIAHRFSTIKDADFIYVIDNGKIVGAGTIDELLESNEIFNEMYRLQKI